jgi:ADP-ribosylglycohydrolase
MLGAIAGDIIGSVYEGWRSRIKTTDFPLFQTRSRFTDDTVLTVAVADAILNGQHYGLAIKRYGLKYPNAGYGEAFYNWLRAQSIEPYNSWGNGSAMRVSPVGFAFTGVDAVLSEAEKTAIVSHNHPEGVRGAQAVALAVYFAKTGCTKEEIKREICLRFGYDLSQTLERIRPTYQFDVSCQGSVPQSIIAFLESDSVESAIRNAISLGGDSDTMACIAGGIAEAYYKDIPEEIMNQVRMRLPEDLLMIFDQFRHQFPL